MELERLASFDQWPSWAGKRPHVLAEQGFYHSGKRDIIVCFSCRGEIRDLSAEDDVVKKHNELYPQCSFVLGLDRKNVPLTGAASKYHPIMDERNAVNCNASNSTTEGTNPPTGNTAPVDNSAGATTDTIHEAGVLLDELRSLNHTRGLVEPPQLNGHPLDLALPPARNPPDWNNDDDDPISDVDQNSVNHEQYRLRTFVGQWSDDFFVSPPDLAKAGFYFHSRPDRVQCAFCRGRLLNWQSTDVPLSEHKKFFPTCPFVCNAPTQNISLQQSQETVQVPANQVRDDNNITIILPSQN